MRFCITHLIQNDDKDILIQIGGGQSPGSYGNQVTIHCSARLLLRPGPHVCMYMYRPHHYHDHGWVHTKYAAAANSFKNMYRGSGDIPNYVGVLNCAGVSNCAGVPKLGVVHNDTRVLVTARQRSVWI